LPIAEGKYQVHPLDSELKSVADWLTQPLDENLIAIKSVIKNFFQNYLDPDTAEATNLDWLAQLCGYVGEYWETQWSEQSKRTLLKNYCFVWESKGSRPCLEFLLNVFAISSKIYLLGEFLAGRNCAGESLGGEALEYFLLLPLRYLRTSEEWRLASKINRLYSPCYVKSIVCYSQFTAGFSAVGEPVFDANIAI
jgi:hypothetical protein